MTSTINMMNLFMFGCVIWIIPLMYFLLRNETKFKKNIVIGVTFPYEGREDPEVQGILTKFKRQLGWIYLALAVAVIPCLFLPKMGIAVTTWGIWILAVCVLPMVPYARCNMALKRVKEARGWMPPRAGEIMVNLSEAVGQKWLSPRYFLLPLAVSLLPLIFDLDLYVLYGVDGGCILLFWLSYRYLYRNKAEMVDENILLTEALTHIRRYNWGKCWMWAAWGMAALNIGVWLAGDNPWIMTAVALGFAAILTVVVTGVEFRTRRLQEKLTADSGKEVYVDEDDKWIWGILYYNPRDSRLVINNRIGINSSFNLARPAGKVLMVILALILLSPPLLGIWIDREASTPVEVTATETVIAADHVGTEYEVAWSDVKEIRLLPERPEMMRTGGTGLDTVLKGHFRASDLGNLTVCLDPRTGPYLLITTKEGKKYLFGSSTKGVMEKIYKEAPGGVR